MYIKKLYEYYKLCQGVVSTDSRTCPKGSLFFALKGDNFDGNQYAPTALKNGAAYAVVDNAEVIIEGDDRYILVHNSLYALQQLANLHRQMLDKPILAITGTNGKTTTKELIAEVLNKKYKTHYTKGNFNNHIGVPLTLLSMKPDDEMGVIEMGANHLGEIKDLTRIVLPDFGLITNVGKAHLEGFGSIEGVINTKTELYNYLKEKKGGTIFLNNDDSILKEKAYQKNKAQNMPLIITYGSTGDSTICGFNTEDSLTLSLKWYQPKHPEIKPQQIHSQLIGGYNLPNILAAIAIGVYFKVPIKDIKSAIEAYTPTNNRSQYKKTQQNKLIIDAYNANPTSMLAALDNFNTITQEHKVAILGDMKELGADSIKEHQAIVDYLNLHPNIEDVYLIGQEFGKTKHAFKYFENIHELEQNLKEEPLKNKTILIKGSNSIHLFDIINLL